MTEQNQASLEQMLLQIGTLSQIHKGIKNEEDKDKLSEYYTDLANTLGRINQADPKDFYKNIIMSPVNAVKIARETVNNEVEKIKDVYNENKNSLVEQVASMMKNSIKNVKDKSQAALVLAQYITGIEDPSKLNQETADKYATSELEEKSGISMLYDIHGDINKYKGVHETNSLAKRIIASEYLKEIKDSEGKITGYDINKSKLTETMNEPKNGAIIYTNILTAVAAESQRQREAQRRAS